MLRLENVSKFYYNKGIIASGFSKANLELKIGEFVVITGESGSGKSTLLNVISGLDSYEEGEMYINGKETSHYTEKDFEDYRRKYIGNIFQSFNLITSYTVYQNIELVLLLNGSKKSEIKQKVLDIIEQVGLTKFKNTRVAKLSGGQKQRVAIARAMVKETPIIVADEPTGNLDSKSAEDVIKILKEVAKNKLVIIVTHNIEQVEQYATRIIKMNDGRIIENVEISKIEEEIFPKENIGNNITNLNKIRIGVRNTFNIPTKFILLFMIFFFMSSAILVEYALFQLSEKEAFNDGNSIAFRDLSNKRVLINKKDKTSFTTQDYEKINEIPNIDYIVEDDIFIDTLVLIDSSDITFYGYMSNIDILKEEIQIGRKPEKNNEIVLKVGEDNTYYKYRIDEILNNKFSITIVNDNNDLEEKNKDLIVVGIIEGNEETSRFYVKNDFLEEKRAEMNKNYSKMKVLLNNKYEILEVEPSEKVQKGEAVVDDELKLQFKNEQILNKPIGIYLSNIYYDEELNLNIANTYTKSNFKKLTGLEKYENNRYKVFINKDEYLSLYDKPSYQSSIYVKNEDLINKTIEDIEKLNINAKKVTDFRIDQGEVFKRIIKIVKLIVTIVLIIVLFFISYLIIKIILKSRNIYYTTLRMLGATYKNIKRILAIELFTNATVSYRSINVINSSS